VPSQQADGGQAQGARSQTVQDQREAPAGSSSLDTVAGGILGETEGLSAIAEERAVASRGVERRAAVECCQMGHELDRSLALPSSERVQSREQIVIRQGGGGDEDVVLHTPGVSRRFSRAERGPGML
jgi:hypothetical protein